MGIMGKNIQIILQSIIGLIYLVELIIAAKAVKNIHAPDLAKFFYWYPLVGLAVALLMALKNLHFITSQVSFTLNIISLLFHFSFLSFFIFSVTGKKSNFKIIIFCCSLILIVLLVMDIIDSYLTSFAFANGCLFLFSLYYFRGLLIGTLRITLKNNFIFYICCGIFIGTGLIVPSSLMIKYLYVLKVPNNTIFLFASFGGIGYILMNLIFIKALLCLKQNK